MVSFTTEVRFNLPPLISLFLMLFPFRISSDHIQVQLSNVNPSDKILNLVHYPVIMSVVLAIAAVLSLIISPKINVIILNSVRFKIGNFAGPMALLLLCSLFFPPRNFWFVFLFLTLVSPWLDHLLVWGKHVLAQAYIILQCLPYYIFVCMVEEGDVEEEDSPQVENHVVDLDQ